MICKLCGEDKEENKTGICSDCLFKEIHKNRPPIYKLPDVTSKMIRGVVGSIKKEARSIEL